MNLSLREITADTVRQVCQLKVHPEQEKFVATNALSIAQAHFAGELAWFRAIYLDEEPIGFVMLEDDTKNQEYYLWRFMIAAPHQGKGYGRQALEIVCDLVRSRPGGTVLYTSVEQGEGSAGPFYEKQGFTYTGEVNEGERVMRKEL